MKFKKQRSKFLVFSKFCQIKKLRQIVFIILSNLKKKFPPFFKILSNYIFYLVNFLISSNFFKILTNFSTIGSKWFHNFINFFSKFCKIFSKLGQIFSKLGQILSKLGKIFSKVDKIFSKVGKIFSKVGEILSKLGEILSKLGKIFSKLDEIFSKLGRIFLYGKFFLSRYDIDNIGMLSKYRYKKKKRNINITTLWNYLNRLLKTNLFVQKLRSLILKIWGQKIFVFGHLKAETKISLIHKFFFSDNAVQKKFVHKLPL